MRVIATARSADRQDQNATWVGEDGGTRDCFKSNSEIHPSGQGYNACIRQKKPLA